MKILLTGGAGYAGAHIAGELIASGHQMTILDSFAFGDRGLERFARHPGLRLVQGDIRTVKPKLGEFDAVVHLAALLGVKPCASRPAEARSVNVDGTKRMLDVARASDARFILFSTGGVYGDTGGRVVDEDAPIRPGSLYAETKALAEKAVLEAEGTVLRVNHLCGLSPAMRFPGLVNEFAWSAATVGKLDVYDASAYLAFLHLRDAARAVQQLVRRDDIDGKVWNVAGENLRKREVVSLVLNRLPHTKVEFDDGAAGPKGCRVSSERIRRDIGFTPEYSVQQAIDEVATVAEREPR